ncbi:galactokinase [Cnuella takakiae]|nr:galactokinase [Cnuella takakiae]
MAATFREAYGTEPLVVRSPGRVNIIGEHTDYNEGFVLPAAIDKAIYVAIGKRDDDTIKLFSREFGQSHTTTLSDVHPTRGWANYILGVVDQLQKRGYKLGGFNLVFDGDVPIGAGLSSSAAVECAATMALSELFGLGVARREITDIAQKAEHTYAGVRVGIMDMFASVFGKKNHVIKLDCRSMEYEYVPLNMEGVRIVLLNTNVNHSLASSEYNTRRQECEQGVAWIKEQHPEVHSLRDATLEMLDQHVAPRSKVVDKRCRYVIEEIQRLQAGCEDLRNGHLEDLGQKMFATHDGLSKQYEVSCKELDFLVDHVRNNPAVLGARMMGGGFGGCTINLVKEEAIEDLIASATKAYKDGMGMDLTAYVAQVEDGTSVISRP